MHGKFVLSQSESTFFSLYRFSIRDARPVCPDERALIPYNEDEIRATARLAATSKL